MQACPLTASMPIKYHKISISQSQQTALSAGTSKQHCLLGPANDCLWLGGSKLLSVGTSK